MLNKRRIDTVTVIGGGSAGWLTALYAKQAMHIDTKVIVIESEKYGILGAGEGTTPEIISIFDMLGIPLSRLMKETNCTVKNGIKFINWNGGGFKDYFYHCFDVYGMEYGLDYRLDPFVCSGSPVYMAGSYMKEDLKKYDFYSKVCEVNKVPFYKDSSDFQYNSDPILQYKNLASFSIHFDAAKLAEFLKVIAQERGIKRVEGIVSDYTTDETGDVTSLIIDSGQEIPTNFVFDCSGFKSFFPKKLKLKWESHKKYLPTDSALPFFIPIEDKEEIPPYTQAIAMKYGWAWKTPLQNRYGCGYVYDSNFISEEEARKEIYEVFGEETEYIWPREDKGSFKFNAGYYKTPWVNNIISVGLSSSFIEPLEATSMWLSNSCLGKIFSNPENLYSKDPRIAESFNNYFCKFNEDILNFMYYHYMTSREDTPFWKQFTKEKAPKALQKILDTMEFKFPTSDDFSLSFWPLHSWVKVGLGHKNEVLKDNASYSLYRSPLSKTIIDNHKKIQNNQDSIVNMLSSNNDFMKVLMEGERSV
jgi:tryptophan halogenase